MPIFWLDPDTGKEPPPQERGVDMVLLLAFALCGAVIVAGLFS